MPDKDTKAATDTSDLPESERWICAVRDQLAGANQKVEARLRANLQCKIVGNEPSLLVPPELAEDQPEILEYLHAFTSKNSLSLIEDRRRLELAPIVEKRRHQTPNLAMGISLLLKQTGLPGPTRALSSPHTLNAGNRKIDVAELIRLGAAILPRSRKIVFLPNAFVRTRLLGETGNMVGHACKVTSQPKETSGADSGASEPATTFVQYETRDFHALGYVTNNQFVVTVYLAGGPIINPSLWTHFYNLAESPFTCQILDSPFAGQMYGIFHKTYYIDLEDQITELKTPVNEVA